MAEKPIGDAAQDMGNTILYVGTVGTTAVPIPAVAGSPIILMLVRCPSQTPNTRRLSWSVDNVTFHALSPGEFVGWPIKGNYTQIYIKGNVAGVSYEVVLNTEPT